MIATCQVETRLTPPPSLFTGKGVSHRQLLRSAGGKAAADFAVVLAPVCALARLAAVGHTPARLQFDTGFRKRCMSHGCPRTHAWRMAACRKHTVQDFLLSHPQRWTIRTDRDLKAAEHKTPANWTRSSGLQGPCVLQQALASLLAASDMRTSLLEHFPRLGTGACALLRQS